MKQDGAYVLVYDIADNKLRTRLAKVVEGYGVRVQKSAFECRLTRGMKERLWQELGKFELGETDAVALYSHGPGKVRRLGQASIQPHPQSESYHAVIL